MFIWFFFMDFELISTWQLLSWAVTPSVQQESCVSGSHFGMFHLGMLRDFFIFFFPWVWVFSSPFFLKPNLARAKNSWNHGLCVSGKSSSKSSAVQVSFSFLPCLSKHFSAPRNREKGWGWKEVFKLDLKTSKRYISANQHTSSHRLNSNPFFSMKDCKTKMLHKISGLSKAAIFQYFYVCLLITLPLILASFTLKRKYIKLLKIYKLDYILFKYYFPCVWALGRGRNCRLQSNSKCFSTT